MSDLVKREWVYVMRPKDYEISGCDCGNMDPDWSEYEGHLWCADCKKDFDPAFDGVFSGPIPVQASELLGIRFDRLNLKTQEITMDAEVYAMREASWKAARSEWRDISTAPKDGSWFIGRDVDVVFPIAWDLSEELWFSVVDRCFVSGVQPGFWQPLPVPPEVAK